MAVYYKRRQILLQNTTAILLQNASGFFNNFIIKCDSYYKYDDFITKGNIYYKMRRLLLTATAQRGIYNFIN